MHEEELLKIRELILRAGFDDSDRDAVFGDNALRLFQFRIV
jgi:predicted TIM-barrel fold metal-dependent hydrolase